ncbi:hypothetical protein ACFYXC_00795 [Streptomyces sp. NPDC002701]|uniref:hypothetical protein n=1 Tax=Streptomyces sp. NPDC002701 TaxID=3364661 RepID=UPI0036A5291D
MDGHYSVEFTVSGSSTVIKLTRGPEEINLGISDVVDGITAEPTEGERGADS